MKRIAIVAPYKEYNYGTILQAYALQHVLESEGVDAKYLRYTTMVPSPLWKKVLNKVSATYKKFRLKEPVVKNYSLDDYSFFHFQEFKSFVDGYTCFIRERINVSKQCYNPLTLSACNEFDAFMIGSDQTWSEARYLPDTPYFLDGIDNRYPKLSYAPSIGTTHISDSYLSVLIEKLSKFKALSCREKTNCELLSSKLGREVSYVLDPTFMLSADEWGSMATMPSEPIISKQYVLCYILGEKQSISDYAEKLGVEKGLPVYYIVTRPIYLQKRHHLFATPESFLWLIKNAAYVITDSFHGSILSINFNTQFYSFTKRDGLNSVDNDRILEILSTLDLSNRYKDGSTTFEQDTDYCEVNPIVDYYRKESLSYLRKTINIF